MLLTNTIIIEIESMEFINHKKNTMENALKIINSEQTKADFILIVFYNMVKILINIFIKIKYIYYKKFYINETKFLYSENIYHDKKPLILYMYDSGIVINDFHISYEHILYFGNFGNYVKMKIFANLVLLDGRLQLELGNGIVDILFLCDFRDRLCIFLKKNMYYHIKFNKLNDYVIKYYRDYSEKIEE